MDIIVKIADMKISKANDVLITYALGSCVGVCVYDYSKKIGGLSHILLPHDSGNLGKKDPYKYANTAIIEMVRQMEKQGCSKLFLTAKIAGGAQMFSVNNSHISQNSSSPFNIGERNIQSVRSVLKFLNIPIVAEDVGGNYGRTMKFDLSKGLIIIKSVGHGDKML